MPTGANVEQALRAGTLEPFWALAENAQMQAEPAFCGPSALAVALNALGVDPGRTWMKPWRWWTEQMLGCCKPLAEVRKAGMSLREFAALARCQGANTSLTYASDASLDAFRDVVRATSRARPARDGGAAASILVVAFSRRALQQTGGGHFSPVAGYHAETDSALVIDIARFKVSARARPQSRARARAPFARECARECL